MKTAKAKLVAIVFPFGTADRLVPELERLGVSGYTSWRVDGAGFEGTRRYGLVDGANVRLETVVTPQICDRILQYLLENYSDVALIAHAHDVQAIPREHFVSSPDIEFVR